MAVTISDTEYKQYQSFLNNYKFSKKINSVKETKFLEYDIDEPIRNIIAMFALLRCKPLFSCCGFNYQGQPMHKTHRFGSVYIQLEYDDNIKKVICALYDELKCNSSEDGWLAGFTPNTVPVPKIYLQASFEKSWILKDSNQDWNKQDCIHYPEWGVFKIKELEQALWAMNDDFSDKVILTDGNHKYKEEWRHWQYPALEQWTIKKNDYKRLSDQYNNN